MTSLTVEQRAELAKAQALQIRRERWGATLAALPCEKAKLVDFPYANLDEALDDGFRKLEGGSARLMQLAKKAWKTEQWREKAAENRATRDAKAELELGSEAAVEEAIAQHTK
jgi:hypothetical protein